MLLETKTLKGTTTIGLVCKDGVVFVADKRASYGTFIASKRAQKIFNINDAVASTVAGSVGDADSLMRLIQAEAALYEVNNQEKMSPKAIATLMSNILQGSKIFPYLVQLIVGGVHNGSATIYTLDPIGGLIEEKKAATGSGSPIAYGILEQEYSEDRSVEENLSVALKALNSAMQRDSATGDGIALVTITKEGFREHTKEEIDNIFKKFKKT
ncbi:MAG TPA: archaeal proteasome endopeptidase complex subunit beta [Candidatus Altiarchaeales archaeon]|nr:archaeal proteasome endopeptidase complex subunit beta [Candidatus Altiarchaeales archaeon]